MTNGRRLTPDVWLKNIGPLQTIHIQSPGPPPHSFFPSPMSLSLVSPLHPPSPPRSSRRPPFGLTFCPLSPISSPPSTPAIFAAEEHPSTPDSTGTLSVYSTPLSSAPESPSPSDLPAWRAVPPTPPAFLPLSPPPRPPVRRRTHPRPASAVFSGPRSAAAQRRLSLPTHTPHIVGNRTPPSAYRIHRRRSSLDGAVIRLFHIEDDDAASDDGDDSPTASDSRDLAPEDVEVVPKRSVLERQHALLELLVSERNYLAYLRTLVYIYLEQLPMLVSPKALTLPILAPSYSATFAFGRPEEALKDKDKERERRALLSDTELNAIRRNAVQLLELHEAFSSMLSDAIHTSGWSAGINALEGSGELGSELPCTDREDNEQRFESALRSVATLFTTQAATFNVYEEFCAEHLGALEIVKSLRRKRPFEWDAFERHCTQLVAANLVFPDGSSQERDSAAEKEEDTDLEKCPDANTDAQDEEPLQCQQLPTTSLENNSPFPWRLSHSSQDLMHAAVTSSKDTKKENVVGRDPRLRLQFEDYLIKPVQRICKYPLLLGTLTQNRRLQALNGADAIVMDAKQAMMDAAALVDNANLSHFQLQQTSRISARLSAPAVVLAFIRSLSPCTLAGSLDVVRAPALKAKYLAAFLYEGGFLALAKVNRGPRYDLRYWFSLEGFEVSDTADNNPLLPYSFRLSDQVHEFEIAASCHREKQVWMDALRGCLATTPPWPSGTAPSSLEPATAAIDAHLLVDEQVSALPTIQSIPEIETPRSGSPSSPSPLQRQKSAPRAEVSASRGLSEPPPSRRESATSLMNIFGPVIDPDAVTVTRSSPQARSIVDALLEDVFSAACHSARTYAEAHSESLFHVSPTFGAAARSRLTKRESVHVRRRRSYVDPADRFQSGKATRKARPAKVPVLALDCVTGAEQVVIMPPVPSPDALFDSPIAISQCSSATGSRDGSSAASPLADALELPSSLPDTCSPSDSDPKSLGSKIDDLLAPHEAPPKRSRSLVDNFRGFILPHSAPPLRTHSVSRLSVFPTPTPPSTSSTPPSPSQRRRLSWRASIRRRSRSSPLVSSNISDPVPVLATAPRSHAWTATVSASSGRDYPWNVEEESSAESPASSSQPTPPPTPSPHQSLPGCSSSVPRVSPTAPRSMLRSIIATFSRSPSSASVRPDL